jgi:hypothetical protein
MGVQLKDGRIISLYDTDNHFYLRYDDVIDLNRGVIVRPLKNFNGFSDDITDEELKKGYTTLNRLNEKKMIKNVDCLNNVDYDLNVYPHSKNVRQRIKPEKIQAYFKKHGYDVSLYAINHQIENWMHGFKSGYRDEEKGCHLFTPCGCNPFSIRCSTLNDLASDWQITYEC